MPKQITIRINKPLYDKLAKAKSTRSMANFLDLLFKDKEVQYNKYGEPKLVKKTK